ncbi:hypothetical protein B0H19DRAFT_1023955 [Mycena capillaripes]|nr:hypothetical protein B0H19DRAFT_1023955 [Mycena capillaripes]
MQQQRLPPFPPLPAVMGLACYKCFKEEDVCLSRCGGCLRIAYCSPECQKLDWKVHKPICRALGAIMTSNPAATAMLLAALPSELTTDVNIVNKITQADVSLNYAFCERSLQRYSLSIVFVGGLMFERDLTLFEKYLVLDEPRCLVCARTDNLFRMEAARNGKTAENSRRLIPCLECNLSFCCSPTHWEAARPFHDAPCEDVRDNISQCQLNRGVREHIKFVALMADHLDPSGQLIWAPERLKSGWQSLTGLSWEGELADQLRESLGIPAADPITPWIRLASDTLSRAMTILYTLEKLNDDDGWTCKDTLTIHIIGANIKEVSLGITFEEILHRLPKVKTLKLVLCGPDLPGSHLQRTLTVEGVTCPQCKKLGRKRIHEYAPYTYHELVQNKGGEFETPDLCIAFNSGASQASMHTWPATFQVLVERKIPSLFTSLNREEAELEAALLRVAGANLHPALGPSKNPWGSTVATPEPIKVYGFHAVNGWLAGGFR